MCIQTAHTSDESWYREVLKKRGLVDRLAALVALRQPRQVLVRQAYDVELHIIAAATYEKSTVCMHAGYRHYRIHRCRDRD